MGVEAHTEVVFEIVRLRLSIDRAAASTESALAVYRALGEDDDPRSPAADHQELCRQLAALRERVARAERGSDGPRALRAELATLAFFARTLEGDAARWRATLDVRIKELERRRATERRERERLAAERERLARRRDALRSSMVQTATGMAVQKGGECRRTVPVFTLGDGLTVCSMSVWWPRRGLRFAKRWLVTLNDAGDAVMVRRDY